MPAPNRMFSLNLRENMWSEAGLKAQIYTTNQCLPRHTLNEKPINPITHNYIPHTHIREQTLSNMPKPIPATPLLLPPNRSSTPPLAPPHTSFCSWRCHIEPHGLWKFKNVYKHLWTFRPPNYNLTNSSFMTNNKCAENEHKL